jgi:hypothetical protein
LYLDYSSQKNNVRLGRQVFDSPLINTQDGRIIPTLTEGLWIRRNEKKLEIGLGFLWAIAPRGAGGFYSVENSFGALAQGRSILGVPANYRGNIESKGIVVAMVDYKPQPDLGVRVWNYFTENVFNSLYLEADKSIALNGEKQLKFSGQYIWQSRVNDGGNADIAKAYFDEDQSHTFGIKSDFRLNKQWSFTLAGNLTTDHGRFLFPREWGREGLYTFLRRERTEGNGANKAISFIVSRKLASWDFKASWGRYWHASPDDPLFNKYGVPSYDHMDWSAKYQFKGRMNRLSAELILIYKYTFEEQNYAPQYIINRVNLLHLDFILNYRIGG